MSSSSNPTSMANPLSHPSSRTLQQPATAGTPNKAMPIDDKRIYVGNLDPAIDEYMVLKLFSPYGKITKLDFMFHWSGPKKGAPRGYCFLEFEKASQATDATKAMNRKVIKSRPLSVSLANVAPPSTDSEHHGRKRLLDPNRPTAFSLLKSGALKNASTNEKIRAMERKLAEMSAPPVPTTPVLPIHSSLPLKPKVTASGTGKSSSPSSSIARDSGPARGNRSASGSTRRQPY